MSCSRLIDMCKETIMSNKVTKSSKSKSKPASNTELKSLAEKIKQKASFGETKECLEDRNRRI